MKSLRQRTLAVTLLVFGLSMLMIGFISYRFAAQEVEELYDASLAQNARLLEGFLAAPLAAEERGILIDNLERALLDTDWSNPVANGHRYESQFAFQLWDGGQLLMRSPGAPETMLDRQPLGFSSHEGPRHHWRNFALAVGTSQRVVVSERQDVRDELIREVALRTLLPDLLGLPLLAGLLWWSIGWGLAPLSRMAEQLRHRDPTHLRPLSLPPLPLELDTIAGAINRLLKRLRDMRIREKRFIADAAHELRSPLAVLDLHAQNALSAQSAEDREESLHHLRHGVARSTRLVGQLLTLARLDPEETTPQALRDTNVLHEAREILAKLSPLAAERSQQLLLEADEQAPWHIKEEPGAIEALMQNLVGNAIQHSPVSSSVKITLEAAAQSVTVIVDDQGPGIAPEMRQWVIERFQRAGPGAGAGLGLSIVDRLVGRHGGTLALEDAPGGGLRVRATLARIIPQR
ncbi:ATP-binding protein [Vreelandella sp. EE22]